MKKYRKTGGGLLGIYDKVKKPLGTIVITGALITVYGFAGTDSYNEIKNLEDLAEPTPVVISQDTPKEITEEIEAHYPLTAAERDLVERVVSAESRGECIEGQMAVAQTILDRAVSREQSITEVCSAKWQFAEPYPYEVSEKTKDAVSLVYDKGEKVFDKVTHFYAWKLIEPPHWVSDKDYKGEIGGVRFYADK